MDVGCILCAFTNSLTDNFDCAVASVECFSCETSVESRRETMQPIAFRREGWGQGKGDILTLKTTKRILEA